MNTTYSRPSRLKRMEKWLKNIYMDMRIYLHYRDLNPDVIQLSHSDQRVSVNPADARARKRLIVDSLRGRLPRNQLFWRRACEQLQPAIALDVGVNYGECLFSVDYPKQTRAIGIEANPFLMPHLKASQGYHKRAAQIELHNVLAGETPNDEVSFFINRQTSGESTAAVGSVNANPKAYEQVSVPQVQVDDLLGGNLNTARPIVFKIDVEGYEEHVFRGMQKVLNSSADLVGLIEFDLDMLHGAGSDPEAFFNFLTKHFKAFLFIEKTKAISVSEISYSEFHAILARVKFHSDLLLMRTSTEQPFGEFLQPWLPKSMAA